MATLVKKYPLDLTGESPKNRVLGEVHNLSKYRGYTYRAFCLNYGYFFADNLSVRDAGGNELKLNVDYQLANYSAKAISETGLKVCATIVVVNPKVTDQLMVDASMVGGEYSSVSDSVAVRVNALLNDDRSVRYGNIVNKPDKFTPSRHLHALWTLYGYEEHRNVIQQIIEGLRAKNVEVVTDLYNEYVEKRDGLVDQFSDDLAAFQEHVDRRDNPHRVTKDQLQLSNLGNWPKATVAQVQPEGDGVNNVLMTPLRAREYVDFKFGERMDAHDADKSRPHRETPAQLGAETKGLSAGRFSLYYNANDTVAMANQFAGRTYGEMYVTLRSNLDAGQITSGRVALSQLGPGPTNRDTVLTAGGWVSFRTLFNQVVTPRPTIISSLFEGTDDQGQNHVRTTYANVRVGTVVLYQLRRTYASYTGNGTVTVDYKITRAMRRTASGWYGPHGNLGGVYW